MLVGGERGPLGASADLQGELRLALYLEQVVHSFARFHRYTLGTDLRDGAPKRVVCDNALRDRVAVLRSQYEAVLRPRLGQHRVLRGGPQHRVLRAATRVRCAGAQPAAGSAAAGALRIRGRDFHAGLAVRISAGRSGKASRSFGFRRCRRQCWMAGCCVRCGFTCLCPSAATPGEVASAMGHAVLNPFAGNRPSRHAHPGNRFRCAGLARRMDGFAHCRAGCYAVGVVPGLSWTIGRLLFPPAARRGSLSGTALPPRHRCRPP